MSVKFNKRYIRASGLRQRGNLMISTVISLAIVAILLVSQTRATIIKNEFDAGSAQGTSIAAINNALGEYITTPSITPNLQNGLTVPGVANSMAPTVAELQTLGLLNASFRTTPLNGGSYVTEVVILPAGCTGLTCNIATRVWMTNPVIDAMTNKLDISHISGILTAIGGNGGFASNLNPATINGSGGWTLPNPDGAKRAGIILAINGYGSVVNSNYVRIRDIRDPDLQGPLTVQGNITTPKYLGLGGSATNGAACPSAGLLGKDSTGTVLICQGGLWQNVAGINNLVTAGSACTAGQVGSDSKGVFMTCQGGVFQDAAGFPNNVVAGGACAASGLFGMDSTGVSYLCRGGFWISQAKLNPYAVEMGRYVVTDGNPLIPKPTCSSGGTAVYEYAPTTYALDLTQTPPYETLTFSATDNGSYWTPSITLKAPNGATESGNSVGVSGIFKVACAYAA